LSRYPAVALDNFRTVYSKWREREREREIERQMNGWMDGWVDGLSG